jgi:hypothetical protein
MVIKPRPPSWMSPSRVQCPGKVRLTEMFRGLSPITQTVLVERNRVSIQPIPSGVAWGVLSRRVPAPMRRAKLRMKTRPGLKPRLCRRGTCRRTLRVMTLTRTTASAGSISMRWFRMKAKA